MKEFIIVISDGPMGSTTIASIIGNCNYLTFPLRHLGLNKYLTKEYDLNHPFCINRLKENIKVYTKPRLQGGRSIQEKDTVTLLDKKINNEIPDLEIKKFSSILEKYFFIYELFNKYCIYKEKQKKYDGIVELATDIQHYQPSLIQQRYKEEFKKVRYISLNRNFKNWLNSICSQRFKKKIKFKYLVIRLSSQIKRNKNYNSFINKLENNTIISFEHIFEKEFLKKFFLKLNLKKKKNFDKLKFDHYGKLLEFNEIFQPIDDQYYFINKLSFKIIDYAEKYYDNKILRFILDIIFQISYLKDYIFYKIKRNPVKR